MQNADNMDIHPAVAAPNAPNSSLAKPVPSTSKQVIKVSNKDMKVAIAFDYMRVKIGEICEMEKFNDALNALLVTEDEQIDAEGEVDSVGANANGKRASEDDAEGKNNGKKQKKQKGKNNRNN